MDSTAVVASTAAVVFMGAAATAVAAMAAVAADAHQSKTERKDGTDSLRKGCEAG
jgi:hypothetical protein